MWLLSRTILFTMDHDGVGRVEVPVQRIQVIWLAFVRNIGTRKLKPIKKASLVRCTRAVYKYARWFLSLFPTLLRPAGLVPSSQDAPRLGSGEPHFAVVNDWIRTLFFHSPSTPVRPHSTWSEMSYRAGVCKSGASTYIAVFIYIYIYCRQSTDTWLTNKITLSRRRTSDSRCVTIPLHSLHLSRQCYLYCRILAVLCRGPFGGQPRWRLELSCLQNTPNSRMPFCLLRLLISICDDQ
ncbi:hypothetical protein LZ30DRAFT_289889 [Colletotrichum cereale]|nr:hypothetical protein LZ30DRAFT_289889 [Colletotrichum cereale]